MMSLLCGKIPSQRSGTIPGQVQRTFDARYLTAADKRFLQAALAFEGHYNGLLDGDWGPLSQDAFKRYSYAEFQAAPEDWHMAMLAFSLFDRIESDGWKIQFFDFLGMSLFVPADAFRYEGSTENFSNAGHTSSSLSYSFTTASLDRTQSIHDYAVEWHEIRTAPYVVRNRNLAITRSEKYNGSVLYTRSNFINGQWSTVMISAGRRDVSLLNAVASSISVGRGQSLWFTENGHLYDALLNVLAVIEDGKNSEGTKTSSASPQEGSPEKTGGAGSGFIVSASGHVLTNAHVVEGCEELTVDDLPATLLSASETFDLALLNFAAPVGRTVAVFSGQPARLNSDVTVAGYPYFGVLGGLNVTRGSVSSLKGLAGAETQMQISAPVQAGNSGGPVLSKSGQVVGVVVSKLDAQMVADATGDLPQNVNFAVRGEVAKLFLSQNGVNPIVGDASERLEGEKLAEMASEFTVFIECAN